MGQAHGRTPRAGPGRALAWSEERLAQALPAAHDRLPERGLVLTAIPPTAADRVRIIERGTVAPADRLAAVPARLDAVVHGRRLPGPAFRLQELEGAMVRHQVRQAITAWAAEWFA